MTLKLNPQLRLIKAPVILVVGVEREEWYFPDGEALTTLSFDKQYMVNLIEATVGSVVVMVKVNDSVNDIT